MSLHIAEESPFKDETWIRSGIPALDTAIAEGIPVGRITQIVGMKSTGKTTLAITMMKAAQAQGITPVFCDAENAFNFSHAEKLGVNLKKLMIVHAEFGEAYLDTLEELIAKGKHKLLIVDSVDALVPRVMIEGTNEQQFMGVKARMLGKFLRKVIFPLKKHKVALVLLNQFRMNIMTGQQEAPGGLALQYYTSVIVKLKQSARLQQGENVVGIKVDGEVIKNKVGAPYQKFTSNLLFASGFSENADILELAIKRGFVERTGNKYSFSGETLGIGLPKARTFLEAHPEIVDKLKALL